MIELRGEGNMVASLMRGNNIWWNGWRRCYCCWCFWLLEFGTKRM